MKQILKIIAKILLFPFTFIAAILACIAIAFTIMFEMAIDFAENVINFIRHVCTRIFNK